jgi:PmbA protein
MTKIIETSLADVAKKLLSMTEKLNVSEAEVSLGSDEGLSVSVRLGELETVEFHQGKHASVTVYLGKRCATASTTDLSENSLEKTVHAAHSMAQFAEEDPCFGLADKSLLAKEYPDLEQDHGWGIDSKTATHMAIESEKKALALDKRIVNSDGVSLSTHRSQGVYANTNGFCGQGATTNHMMSCSLVSQDGKDMQRASDYTFAYDPQYLKSMDDVALTAAHKAIQQLNPQKLPTQHASIIFDAEIASSLIGNFIAAISGGNLYRESTFLLNQLGKQIFPEWVDIIEDPHRKNTIGAAPFDAEGVLTRKKHFVHKGILESYALGSYSARRLGLQSTANAGGIFNLSIGTSQSEHVVKDRNALLKKMDKGVLVTSLMGSSISILTGDYSRGAAGFWVENGEIQYPVHEFTIASNLKDMFKNILAIATDIDSRKNIKTGSILLTDMMIAGE